MKWIRNKWLYFYNLHSNRNMIFFGLLMSLLALFLNQSYSWNFTLVSIIVAIQFLGIAFKRILRVEFATLTLITFPIGSIVSFLVMGFVFYLILTPIGFFRTKKYKAEWITSVKEIEPEKLNE